jgi:proton-translocating NAD(P)+ transhydrogenase subunit alpha
VLHIGVPRETFSGERRVALVPGVLPLLKKIGAEVLIEQGAGASAGYPDDAFVEKGARIVSRRADLFAAAELIVQVRAGGANREAGRADLALLGPAKTLLGFLDPLSSREALRELASTGVTAFSIELLPRITRAQGMDALSSMATLAGYKAVLLAAGELPRVLPLLMTAAGTLKAARVLVIGAGVAGLQAIATARRLGAVVYGYDVRPAAKEQVLSLGARFVELPLEAADAQDASGYARAQDESFYRKQQDLLGNAVAESDAVITTAQVPGKRAPVLVTAAMVDRMPPGSVIVDLAAEQGGNCEVTRAGERVARGGVTVLGPVNLPATVPLHASQMYARNLASFVQLICKDGVLALDQEDEIVRETLVARGGEIVHARLRDAPSVAASPSRTS